MTTEEIKQTAFHEAGHYLGAAHFKMRSFPEVTPSGFYSPSSTVTLPAAGVCHIPDPLTRDEACVVGWCGVLAQCIGGVRDDWMPSCKVTEQTLPDLHLMLLARLEYLSPEDARMIRGGGGKIWRACKSAFKILSRNKARLKRIAKDLAADAEKRQAASFSLTPEPVEPVNATTPQTPAPMNATILKPVEPEPVKPTIELTPVEMPGRVQTLKNFLARLTADDPQRPKFQKMLECLERGEKLPDEF